jgi:hypothetical protein
MVYIEVACVSRLMGPIWILIAAIYFKIFFQKNGY